jgi:outer membrane lipoprotein-sorting protein
VPSFFPRFSLPLALLVSAGLNTSCLVRSSKPIQAPLITQTATLEELTAKLQRLGKIRSMKATVEFGLSAENEDRTRLQEFHDAPGFILARRPGEIHTIAQVPVVRATALEMASNGQTFQVYLPTKKRFFVGETAEDHPSEKRMENIRPNHILDALLIDPPQADEIAVLENAIEGLTPYQVVSLIRLDKNKKPKLARKFWFSRETLELSHMQILDDLGNTVTLALYEQWAEQESLPYPTIVTVIRPLDGYSLRIHFLQPGLNETVPEDSFVLEAPEGVTVEHIGEPKSGQANARAESRNP